MEEQSNYGIAPLWDFETGDFVGGRNPTYGDGYDTLVQWCMKIIRTERWAYLGYSNDAGVEIEEAFQENDREAIESELERTITETLLADPSRRTVQVQDFEFVWDADALTASCVVLGADGNSAVISATF